MSKEFKIGLITVIAGALLYYGFNFLRGSDLFSPTNRYYVKYSNVAGLNVSNPVYLNGLPIGRVSGFSLIEGNEIIVSLDVDQTLKIRNGSSAHFANDGLLGSKAIVLVFGESEGYMNPGDTLKSETDGTIFDRFDPAIDNINTTITKLNEVLDQIKDIDIKGAVETLKETLQVIKGKTSELDVKEPLDKFNALADSFTETSEKLQAVLDNSNSLVDSLKNVPLNATLVKLNESLDQVNSLMVAVQSDSGSVGQLLNNDSLYNSLNKTLVDLDALIIHFRTHPKDFLKPLGRKNKKLKGISQEGGE